MTRFWMIVLAAISIAGPTAAQDGATYRLSQEEHAAAQRIQQASIRLADAINAADNGDSLLPRIADLPEGVFVEAFDVDSIEVFADREVGLISTLCRNGQAIATAYMTGGLSREATSSSDPAVQRAVMVHLAGYLVSHQTEVALATRYDLRCNALVLPGFNQMFREISSQEAADMSDGAANIRNGIWRTLDTMLKVAASPALEPANSELILQEMVRQMPLFNAVMTAEQRMELRELIANGLPTRELDRPRLDLLNRIAEMLAHDACSELCAA